jgi:hypothetical protein
VYETFDKDETEYLLTADDEVESVLKQKMKHIENLLLEMCHMQISIMGAVGVPPLLPVSKAGLEVTTNGNGLLGNEALEPAVPDREYVASNKAETVEKPAFDPVHAFTSFAFSCMPIATDVDYKPIETDVDYKKPWRKDKRK